VRWWFECPMQQAPVRSLLLPPGGALWAGRRIAASASVSQRCALCSALPGALTRESDATRCGGCAGASARWPAECAEPRAGAVALIVNAFALSVFRRRGANLEGYRGDRP